MKDKFDFLSFLYSKKLESTIKTKKLIKAFGYKDFMELGKNRKEYYNRWKMGFVDER